MPIDTKNIDLTPEFEATYDQLENSNDHVFITGKAGTGKSTLLQYFRENTKKKVAVVAPTGIAALNVQGETIHSFFGFSPRTTEDDAAKSVFWNKNKQIIEVLDTIIIDEVSMVRADLLDFMDIFLRKLMKSEEPFGGKQLIMFGDLYQLPPVVTKDEKQIFNTRYKSPFFFQADVMQKVKLKTVELSTIWRQSDEDFITILNEIRHNNLSQRSIQLLNDRVLSDASQIPKGAMYLATTNYIVQSINDRLLNELPVEVTELHGSQEGDFRAGSMPTDEVIKVKPKAQIMFVNNDKFHRWVNGTIGHILDINESSEEVLVKLADGQEEIVTPHQWEMLQTTYDGSTQKVVMEKVGSFTQFPFKLAWAVTIHKSQGQTFDNALIDLNRGTFASGQLYVALSRCKSLDGVYLRRAVRPSDVLVDEEVVNFTSQK